MSIKDSSEKMIRQGFEGTRGQVKETNHFGSFVK